MAAFEGVFGRPNKTRQTSSLFNGVPNAPKPQPPASMHSNLSQDAGPAAEAVSRKKRKSQTDAALDVSKPRKQKEFRRHAESEGVSEAEVQKAGELPLAKPSEHRTKRQTNGTGKQAEQPSHTTDHKSKGRKKHEKRVDVKRNLPANPTEAAVRADSAAPAEQPLPLAANGIEQAEDHGPDDKLDRTVFVGNLHATIKPKQIKQLFSRYGKVESVRLRSVPLKLDAQMPRRAAVLTDNVDADRATAHAYVVFAMPEEAHAALAHNMQLVNNLHVIVNLAAGRGGTADAKSYNRSRSIFVGNVHFAVQDEDLVRFFSNGQLDPELEGAVTAVRVVRDRETSIGKGIAFVEFKTKAAAAAAMRLSEPKLGGRVLRISYLKMPKATAQPTNAKLITLGNAEAKPSGGGASQRLMKKAASKSKAPSWMGVRTKGPTKTSGQPAAKIAPIKPAASKPSTAKAGTPKSKPRHGAKQRKGKSARK